VIRGYVAGGGGLIVHGFGYFGGGNGSSLLNTVFGYSLSEVDATTATRTFEATPTQFNFTAATLPPNNGTSALRLSSLPDDAFPMFADAANDRTPVTLFRYGLGEITFMGWDWFNANPPISGGQNNGWHQVLRQAVAELTTDPNPNGPRADAGGPYETPEGVGLVQLTLDGLGTTDPNQSSDTLNYAWDLDYDGLFGETGAAAVRGNEVGPTPTFNASAADFDGPIGFRVLLRVTDSTSLVSYSSANIKVVNAAPTAQVTAPATPSPFVSVEITVGATDPSAADTAAGFQYQVDWGDGGMDFFGGDGAGVAISHVYTLSGARTVVVTATDKDGGVSTPVSHNLTVNSAVLTTDPYDDTRQVLIVAGTEGNDVVRIGKRKPKSPLAVQVNGLSGGTFEWTGPILIVAGPGNDNVVIDSGLSNPSDIDAGDGDDMVTGGQGPDIVIGGLGNDLLLGGNGRDLLIGGYGVDDVRGGDGDDLLIAGISQFEFDVFGRRAIMAEWTRTDQNYERRVDHLRFGGGFNGGYTLFASDDGEADLLTGNRGDDWFFWHGSSGVKDQAVDLKSNEYSTEIFP
jgi:hypothetical protein